MRATRASTSSASRAGGEVEGFSLWAVERPGRAGGSSAGSASLAPPRLARVARARSRSAGCSTGTGGAAASPPRAVGAGLDVLARAPRRPAAHLDHDRRRTVRSRAVMERLGLSERGETRWHGHDVVWYAARPLASVRVPAATPGRQAPSVACAGPGLPQRPRSGARRPFGRRRWRTCRAGDARRPQAAAPDQLDGADRPLDRLAGREVHEGDLVGAADGEPGAVRRPRGDVAAERLGRRRRSSRRRGCGSGRRRGRRPSSCPARAPGARPWKRSGRSRASVSRAAA